MKRSSTTTTTGCRRRPDDRSGYVLLMTLALLVVVVLSQAGLARHSLQLALEANQAQSDLQRRWGATSCRNLLLPQAESIFNACEDETAERRPRWPAPYQVHATAKLGEFDVQLTLADEDAKTNLNSIYAKKPADVSLALVDVAQSGLVPELRPDLSREAKLRRRSFGSWGNVFPVASTLSDPEGWDRLGQVAQELTCWGDGKPNIRRASDQTLKRAITTVSGGAVAQHVLEARRSVEDDLLLTDLLATLDLKRAEQIKIRSVLSDRSSCYSLSLALGDGRGRWYHLWIDGDRATGGAQFQSFSW